MLLCIVHSLYKIIQIYTKYYASLFIYICVRVYGYLCVWVWVRLCVSLCSFCVSGYVSVWMSCISPSTAFYRTAELFYKFRFVLVFIKATWGGPENSLEFFTNLRLEIAKKLVKISQYRQKTTDKWKIFIPAFSVLE